MNLDTSTVLWLPLASVASFPVTGFWGLGVIHSSGPIQTTRKDFLILCLRSLCEITVTRKFLCNELANNYRLVASH